MAEVKIQIPTSTSNNPSLQVGDFAFHQTIDETHPVDTADNPIYIGPILDIGDMYIIVDTSLDPSTITGFLMYSKDKRVNNSSLNGYYAEVTFRNNDIDNRSEIFAISSEVSQSSK
tara:strand:- start:464 stop:811 length:348 start_codon:yes stop_codon:yes gene_type:complete